jgi:hypothetical protein
MSDYKPGSIKSIGREFCPTATVGRRYKSDIIKDFNQRSAESLARINAKLGKPSPVPLRIVVDKHLHTHAQK